MYVAVKGGEAAIDAAHEQLAEARRGDPAVPEIGVDQIREQLSLAVARVMSEGSLYDPDLAALAVKQARGDLIEAIFLLRAFRTTLPRFGYSSPLATDTMEIERRVSATYKDLPGGQVLGPTFDYTHRLLDPELASAAALSSEPAAKQVLQTEAPAAEASPEPQIVPHVTKLLDQQDLIETSDAGHQGDRDTGGNKNRDTTGDNVGDLTRDPLEFPAARDIRLQSLARGDEGFLLAMGYSTQRGFGRTHPFAGEIRMGEVDVYFEPEELGFEVPLGSITVTECEMVTQFKGAGDHPPKFTRGYGLAFGHSERKAMSMALVDRSLRAGELGEASGAPAQDEEFVLSHADNVQATGFVEHLKLPHYVDFQAELTLVRQLREEWDAGRSGEEPAEAATTPEAAQ